jgi:gliding motility-associated-like protein
MPWPGSAVFGQLHADFSMDRTGGCSPLVVAFTNRTTGASGNAVYKWDFGNGNTSQLANGGAIYITVQTYTVTLTVEDGANQSASTQQVSVYKTPIPDFSVSPTKICLNTPVIFTSSSDPGSGSISNYAWDFGDGSTVQGPGNTQSYTYSTVQQATVSLTVTNNYGCHATVKKINIVNIIPALTAAFSADKKVLCLVSDPVQFTNTSNGPGSLDYTWDFGDGTKSTQTSPQHIFNKKGIYSVQLTAHSSEGCTTVSTQTNALNVASYTTSFDLPSPICNGSYVTFNNTSAPAADNSVWEVDGSPQYAFGNLSYTFYTSGAHTITLNNEFGTCPQSASKQISVKDIPAPNGFMADINGKCGSPVPVNFKDVTAGAVKWEWDFNYNYYNGGPKITSTVQAPSYTYAADGQYLVWLRVTNADGCMATTSQYVTIAKPTVYISAGASTLSSCTTLMTNTFTTNASEPLVATSWNFGDGNSSIGGMPTHTFKNTGSYTVILNYTTQSGCKGIASLILNSLSPPPPVSVYTGAGPIASCTTPIATSFGANSSDPVTSYKWNFGDGASSTDPTPSHTYDSIGHYNARLDYTTQAGCKGTVYSPTIVIDPKIKSDFNPVPNPVCGSSNAGFVTSPNISDINIYNWDFGDGSTLYGNPNPTHVYNASGDFIVTVYMRNIGGCDTTIQKKVTIKPPFPIITGHSAPTCDGTRGDFTFTQASLQATTVTWSFGDGVSATTPGDQPSVKHTYAKTGIYSVSMMAVNGQCSLVATDPSPVYVLVKQNPVLTGSATSVCSNGAVAIQITGLDRNPYQSDNVYDYYNYYASYFVQNGLYRDGIGFAGTRIDNSPRWTTVYGGTISNFKAGEKDIRFILTSAVFGCQDTTSFMPLAIKGAVGGFEVVSDNHCYQSPVVFQDTSYSTPDNPIRSRLWYFGDGQTVTKTTGGTVSHTYNDPGTYSVSMQITDASGCSSNIPYMEAVTVRGPKAAFAASGTDVHLNTTVYFYNNTNDYGNSNTVYQWNFGDGTSSTDVYPSHTYPVAGTYTVTMTASNPSLPCSSVATPVTIIVRNFNSAFSFSSSYVAGSCAPLLVSFVNTSYNYVRVAWDFGDGITAGNVNYPSHIYEKPGKYIVTLSVFAYNGVQGTYIDSVIISQPAATLAANPQEVCIGSTVSLKATAKNTTNYTWDFGDGNVSQSAVDSIAHPYLVAGIYETALLIQDASGCQADAKANEPVTVRPNPVVAVSPDKPFICKGAGTTLSATGGSAYHWKPVTGLSNASVADPFANPALTTGYSVSVTDDFGCSDTGAVTLTVVQPGSLSLSGDTAVCEGKSLQLVAAGKQNYSWINNTEGLSNTGIPDPVANPQTTIVYTLSASDDHDCFPVSRDVTVSVLPLPTVNAGQDVEVWAGEKATLNTSASSDVVQWAWSPASYLSCGNCAAPVCTPLASTVYTLTVKNQDGCTAADDVAVKVDCEASRVAIPNAFTPNGDGVNDVFAIRGISIVKHLVIYGRWGEKVFERNNFIAGDRSSWWDGTYQGTDAPVGSYVYFVEMECASGGPFTRKGTVVLIR